MTNVQESTRGATIKGTANKCPVCRWECMETSLKVAEQCAHMSLELDESTYVRRKRAASSLPESMTKADFDRLAEEVKRAYHPLKVARCRVCSEKWAVDNNSDWNRVPAGKNKKKGAFLVHWCKGHAQSRPQVCKASSDEASAVLAQVQQSDLMEPDMLEDLIWFLSPEVITFPGPQHRRVCVCVCVQELSGKPAPESGGEVMCSLGGVPDGSSLHRLSSGSPSA